MSRRNFRVAVLILAFSSFTAQAVPSGSDGPRDASCPAKIVTQTVTVTAVPSSLPSPISRVIDTNNTISDPQTSLTLDPAVIATNFANDGQNVTTAGQIPSLTSTNNFINFCLTVPSFPITDGRQIKSGSCNPAPLGLIPSFDAMPSAKFLFPQNFGVVKTNTTFTIQLKIQNLATGFFVNSDENFLGAPQQLDDQGFIKGHSHVVVEPLTSTSQTEATDPRTFVFFKGLNDQAVDGKLTSDVTGGLPAGTYRVSSIATSANHNPAVVAVAQHGALDDAVYFFVTDDGQAPAGIPVPNGGVAGPEPDLALLLISCILLPVASLLRMLSG